MTLCDGCGRDDCMTCNPAFHKYGEPGQLKNPCREDRFHRYGMRDYSVMVFQGDSEEAARYVIRASSSVDARCMAFLLDGGCEPGVTHFDAGHVELALSWTEVIE